MKKIFALILALALCLVAFAGCAKKEEAKTFTVGFDAEYPPFGFIDEAGEYDGFDLAVAQEVCDRLGWELVRQPIAWDSKDAELAAGNIDCIWNGFTRSEERMDQYTWSEPYYDNSIVMVVKADSGIASLADLAGKDVITQAGSSALTALEGMPELTGTFNELLECADYNSAFMELDMGTVAAIAVDVGVANYQLSIKNGEYIILDEAIASEVYAIGFLKGNTELCDTVWEQVLEIAADGTLSEIADNYVDLGLVKDSITLLG